jgi:hypothetical protein
MVDVQWIFKSSRPACFTIERACCLFIYFFVIPLLILTEKKDDIKS